MVSWRKNVLDRVYSAFKNKDVIWILKLAAISTISLSVSNIHNFFGTIMVGHTGEMSTEQISATGIALLIVLLFSSPMNAFSSATQSIMSKLWGSGKRRTALFSLKSAIGISFLISLTATILILIVGENFIKIMAPDQSVANYSKRFLTIRIIGLPFTSVTFVMRAFFDAIGEPKNHLKFNLYSTVLCIILSYFLVFGVFFPRMELYGFALASSLSSIFAAVYGGLLLKKYLQENFTIDEIGRPEYMEKIADFSLKNFKVAFPAFIASFVVALSFIVFLWASGVAGVEHQAVTFALINILGVVILPASAIAFSLAGEIGRLLGKREIKRAKLAFHDTLLVMGTVTLAISILFLIFPEKIIDIFSDRDRLINIGKDTILFFSPSIPLVFLGMLISTTLVSLGDTKFIVTVESILHFCFFLPSVLILGFYYKADSKYLWLMISIYFSMFFAVLFLRIKSGRWIR